LNLAFGMCLLGVCGALSLLELLQFQYLVLVPFWIDRWRGSFPLSTVEIGRVVPFPF